MEVVAIVAEVLKRETVHVDDDLFDLGAHSLTITGISARLRRRLGAEIALSDLYDHPTAQGIAHAIRSQRTRA